MRRYVWTSGAFYVAGFVMLLCAFGMIAVCAVTGAANVSVEARLMSLTSTLHAVGLMVTSGLFSVAGAILAAVEQLPRGRAPEV
jgi:hypothetical protein